MHRRQVVHDIRHELGTIMMLASALMTSKDMGHESRVRVQQLLAESHWLDELIRAYDAAPSGGNGVRPIRLDELTAEIARSIELSGTAKITVDALPICAHVDRLALWRAVRNVVCNALAAAGPEGTLAVRVSSVDGFAAIDVDDDGPGFDCAESTPASLGLTIVEEFVDSCGGRVRIGRSPLGGCRVRMLLPEADDVTYSETVQRAHSAL
jgi:signal transduction histidine kinase